MFGWFLRAGRKRVEPVIDARAAATMLRVAIDRDSVCAGDDCESHEQVLQLDATQTLGALLRQLRSAHYLASITGGRATWIIESSGHAGGAIGVCAQQWAEPRLTVASDQSLAQHFGSTPPSLHFKYWCQADPDAVFSSIQAGRELPPRHGPLPPDASTQ